MVPISVHSVRGFWKRKAARSLQCVMERPPTLTQRTSHAALAEDQPQILCKGCGGAMIFTMLTPALGSMGGRQVANCLRPSSGWFEYLLRLRYVFQFHRHHRHQKFNMYLQPFCTRHVEPCFGAGDPAFAWLQRLAGALVWEDAASGAASQHLFLQQSGRAPSALPSEGRSTWLGRGCCAPRHTHHPTLPQGEWGQAPARGLQATDTD